MTSPFHINGESEFLKIPLKDVDPTKMHQLQKQMQIPRKRSQSAEKLTIQSFLPVFVIQISDLEKENNLLITKVIILKNLNYFASFQLFLSHQFLIRKFCPSQAQGTSLLAICNKFSEDVISDG